jgi:hypothetical protein
MMMTTPRGKFTSQVHLRDLWFCLEFHIFGHTRFLPPRVVARPGLRQADSRLRLILAGLSVCTAVDGDAATDRPVSDLLSEEPADAGLKHDRSIKPHS